MSRPPVLEAPLAVVRTVSSAASGVASAAGGVASAVLGGETRQAKGVVTLNRTVEEARAAWESAAERPDGTPTFRPATGGRGTVVEVVLEEQEAAGVVGRTVAKVTGNEPEQRLRDGLRRWKALVETGEVPVSAATPGGPSTTGQLPTRPAQPGGHPKEGTA